jgi:Protein of unknown function (DUF1697)
LPRKRPMPRYAAFLRAISNLAMDPFRRTMEDLGFAEVESYGMSGNLLFTAHQADRAALERRIAKRFGTAAFVRTGPELARIVGSDPFRASVLLLSHPPSPSRRRAFAQLDFEEPLPVLRGATLYFLYPARLRGKRGHFDFEVALGVSGTARSTRVLDRVLARMSTQSSNS